VGAFLEATRGFIVPAGSVVALSSVSHLAWVGAAAYAQEFSSARRRLRAAFRNGIEVVHGPALLMGGIDDGKGTLAVLDFFSWLEQCETARDITETRAACLREVQAQTKYAAGTPLAPTCSGSPLAPENSGSPLVPQTDAATPLAAVKYHLYMPIDTESKSCTVFEASHKVANNMRTDPFSKEKTLELIATLADELNSKFMTELGPVIAGDDASGDECENTDPVRLIFIGGSHASRLAKAAAQLGYDVVNLSMPGFRCTEDTIETGCILLREALQENEEARNIVIYQLLDNNVFFESREDGSRSLPSRGEDDRYHITGRLDFADHNVIKTLVNSITPLLRAGGEAEKIILSPLPRYIRRCCRDKSHLTNKADEDYASRMGEALSDMRDSMKDLIFGKKIRSFKVLSTTLLLTGDDAEETADKIRAYWREDPVHMTTEGYTELVEAVINTAVSAAYNRPSGSAKKKQDAAPARSVKRKQWVSEDDTLAHRRTGSSSYQHEKKQRGSWHIKGRGEQQDGGRGGGEHRDDARGGSWQGRGSRGSGSWRGKSRGRGYFQKWRGGH
jgi:hypothetical protein